MMHKPIRAVAIAFAVFCISLTAGGCTTLARLVSNEQAATYDEKALISAELAYSVVLQTVTVAVNTGALDADEARRLRPIVEQAQAAMVRARAAYAAGDRLDASIATRDLIGQVAAATALLEQFGLMERRD